MNLRQGAQLLGILGKNPTETEEGKTLFPSLLLFTQNGHILH